VFEKSEYDDFYFSSRVCLRGPPVIDVMLGNVRVGKVRGSRSRARGFYKYYLLHSPPYSLYCYSSSLICPPSLLCPRCRFVAMSAKVEVEVEDVVKTLLAISSPQLPHSYSFSAMTHRFL
jgi:hypothetical protein